MSHSRPLVAKGGVHPEGDLEPLAGLAAAVKLSRCGFSLRTGS
jgi:hypothetical protein